MRISAERRDPAKTVPLDTDTMKIQATVRHVQLDARTVLIKNVVSVLLDRISYHKAELIVWRDRVIVQQAHLQTVIDQLMYTDVKQMAARMAFGISKLHFL